MLFATFFKIGLFTFGGGYAMIALVEREVVEKRGWLTRKEMLDLIAVAESTPGVIALNTATYVGAKLGGFWAALASSVAVLLPSVIIIMAITPMIEKFGSNRYVRWAFWGIRPAVAALILNAVWKLFKAVDKSVVSYIVMAVSFTLALLSVLGVIPVDIVFIILASALFGIIYGSIKRKKQAKAAAIGAAGEEKPAENQVSAPGEKEADR